MKHKQSVLNKIREKSILDKLRDDLIMYMRIKNVTQEEIASIIGCDQASISKFITGIRGISAENALRIQKIILTI